jgi:DNA repair exonuclease SbcCD nuclease subunit
MTDSNRPLRIAHFSDTHLGYRALTKLDPVANRNQRSVDIEEAFERAIDEIMRRDVDLIIHSGDVFQHTRPSWHTLREFIFQMRRLASLGVPIIVIGGNHDTPRLRTGGSAFSVLDLALPGITFVAGYEEKLLTYDDLNLSVMAVPHGALTNPDPVLPLIAPGKRNILISHGFVPGMKVSQTGEPGEQEVDELLVDSDFDYVALGHYHVAGQVRGNAWYAGSTERMGYGDIDVTPGYNLVTLGAPGETPAVEHIDLPGRPMIRLKPVHGDDKEPREIADRILDHLRALNQPDAMTRVELKETARPERREVESILRRESSPFVWNVQVISDQQWLAANSDEGTIEGIGDLRAMFAEFVASRKGTHYDDEFARALLERGDRALTEAILAAESRAPDDGTPA